MLFGAIFFGVFNGNFIPLFIFIVTFGLFMFFGVIYSYTTTDGVGNIYQREVKDKDPKEPIFLGIYEFRGL